MHYADIDLLLSQLYKLKSNNNTILLVEHNQKVLSHCDYIIELGQGGGDKGGKILFEGYRQSYKHNYYSCTQEIEQLNNFNDNLKFITLKNINIHNVINQTINIPAHKFTSIVGVSGSGKSSAMKYFIQKLELFIAGSKDNSLTVDAPISSIKILSQEQNVQSSRSFVGTFLGVMDEIRDVFSETQYSKKNKLTKSYFSLNNPIGICKLCGGGGFVIDEYANEELCPECEGHRFNDLTLGACYKNFNISEILSMNLISLNEILNEQKKISDTLTACIDIGIGYLSLDRPITTLSKGEFQRLRLAKEIINDKSLNCIYILDEPSKGLSDKDINLLINSIKKLTNKHNTVIAIEHNIHIISKSDYLIEFGPKSSSDGGKVIFEGNLNELLKLDTPTAKIFTQRSWDKNIYETNIAASTEKNKFELEYMDTKFTFPYNDKSLIIGYMASSKTLISKGVIFGNAFKQYASITNPQGKYLTRDVFSVEVPTKKFPLARLINVTDVFYKFQERIAESLDIEEKIADLFYTYSKFNKSNIKRSAFAYSKNSSKCKACKGDGELKTFDFEKLFNDANHKKAIYNLLYKRERLSKISKLLSDTYSITIDKDFDLMTEDEKILFLYGNKKLEVYDDDWGKSFFWSGCNEILKTSLNYLDEKTKVQVKSTFGLVKCKYCNGDGVNKEILEAKLDTFNFKDFMMMPISKLLPVVIGIYKKYLLHEDKFISTLKDMHTLGLGNLSLQSKTRFCSISEKTILQYILYKNHPIYNSLILWDDFSAGKTKKDIELLTSDFDSLKAKGETILLFDAHKNLKGNFKSVVTLGTAKEKYLFYHNSIADYNCIFESLNFLIDENIVHDRLNIDLSARSTFGTIFELNSIIKNIFKKNWPKTSFSSSDKALICKACEGLRYYEINSGNFGYVKKICPDCNGTGFTNIVTSKKILNQNFPDLLNSSLENVNIWLNENSSNNNFDFLDDAIRLKLNNIGLNQSLKEMSYNECSLIQLLKLIYLSSLNKIYIRNFFIDIDTAEKNYIYSILDDICKKTQKQLFIFV